MRRPTVPTGAPREKLSCRHFSPTCTLTLHVSIQWHLAFLAGHATSFNDPAVPQMTAFVLCSNAGCEQERLP
eukprot:s1598_g5.t1